MAGLAENHRTLGDFEIGPMGTGLVYDGEDGRRWYRRWDDLTSRPVAGSVPGSGNQVSRDGGYLLERSSDEIRVIPLEGGPVRRLAVAATAVPRSGGDGYLYFSGPDSTIHRVPELLDGDVERLGVEREAGELLHHSFYVAPGGRTAVSQVERRGGPSRIDGYDLETGRRTALVEGFLPRATPSGHLVYGTSGGTSGGRIMAATLNPRTLEMGPAVEVVSGVARQGDFGLNWSLAWDGTLAYWDAEVVARYELVWVTRSGAATPAYSGWSFDPGSANRGWALSPDDRRVAIRLQTGNRLSVWVKDLETGAEWRVTRSDEEDRHPRWESDSTIVLVSQMRVGDGNPWEVFRVQADGLGEPTLLYEPHEGVTFTKAVPDPGGQWLVLRTYRPPDLAPGGQDVLIQRLGTREAPRPILADPDYAERGPALSPDGRWLAYSSTESGREEVIVRPFPNVEGGRIAVSTAGGTSPVWSDDGSELFYVRPGPERRVMMAAWVTTDPELRVVAREEFFEIGREYRGSWSYGLGRCRDRRAVPHDAPDRRHSGRGGELVRGTQASGARLGTCYDSPGSDRHRGM